MNHSETIGKLAEALSRAQAEMHAAKFNAVNPFLKNNYADLGSIIDTAKPTLGKYGLAVTQHPFNDGDRVGVETVLTHASGEWISSSLSLPLAEEKGKSGAQVAGSIITYLRRYTLSAVLGMYSDEDTDGNSEPKPAEAKPAAKVAEKQPIEDTMTIERAMKITNSEGVAYGEIPSDKLQAMVLGINKGLKNGVDDAKKAEYLEKKQAIQVILKARANKEI